MINNSLDLPKNPDAESIQVSRVLHAGYIFECRKTRICFDPIFENPFSINCYAFPEVKFDTELIQTLQFDAIFISHFHDDHCSLESLSLLNRETPIYIFCLYDEIPELLCELGFKSVHALRLNRSLEIGHFRITPRRALDAEVDSIFHIQAVGLNILNVVDSWIDEETLKILTETTPWDLVLWPFQTLRELEVLSPLRALPPSPKLPSEWISQLLRLKPRIVVPSSCQFVHEAWSWYNQSLFPVTYRQFAKEVVEALPHSQVIKLNPSNSVSLSKHDCEFAKPLSWIQTLGNPDVDYQFASTLQIPPTAEIASKFSPLSLKQSERVRSYCQRELLEKYRSMEIPEGSYFEKPRRWQLVVLDQDGSSEAFIYDIRGNEIQLDFKLDSQATNDETVSWTTEVIQTKFFAALEYGESLTSMYLRINDQKFKASVEKDLMEADIVDDPLIRCLFNGRIGAYQSAQLNRLKAKLEPIQS